MEKDASHISENEHTNDQLDTQSMSASGEAALRRIREMEETAKLQEIPSSTGDTSDVTQTNSALIQNFPRHLNIKVVSQDGNEVYFKIKDTTQLKKLINAYCGRQAISVSSVRFLYDGQRIDQDQTPSDLGMEDNDIIDAVLQQTGGL